MKYVGQFLADAVWDLQKQKCKFTVDYTIPPDKGYFKVDTDALYVVREKYDKDGVLQLIAAAKMRREV
ncbi:hypothetical protein [Pectinatus cerevisiiphilus]|uniref:Uncharacterized protein n=1 Tax=Pectinatus cerevisiiphilus TaxID=86956 RepID=A0A4R3K3Z0_9FIRM|nr:hypothetical protein [Pectinatus cerevisiiphilus]TCS77385.1 hypothetical protein EDC37_11650 [Pectinatus cerevisiiphilus]